MIADAVDLKKERYLAILLDREACCPVVVTSIEGGVNIEDVARTNPDAINKEFIDLQEGMTGTVFLIFQHLMPLLQILNLGILHVLSVSLLALHSTHSCAPN